MNDVSLRPLAMVDLHWLWSWIHERDARWKSWDAPYFHVNKNPPDYETFKDRQKGQLDSPHRLVIELDGQRVGTLTRWEEEPEGGGWWELGIVIFDPESWGKSIGTRALEQWLKKTFDETDAHVVTVTTWSGNERMIRCAKHIGFIECARVPQARSWGGKRWDSVKLAVLRDRYLES